MERVNAISCAAFNTKECKCMIFNVCMALKIQDSTVLKR